MLRTAEQQHDNHQEKNTGFAGGHLLPERRKYSFYEIIKKGLISMLTNFQPAIKILVKYSCNLIYAVPLTMFLLACNDSSTGDNKVIEMNKNTSFVSKEVSQAIQKIKEHRVFFAHHSVGMNIIDGLKVLAEETGVEVKVTSIEALAEETSKGKFVEARPGRNRDPESKINGFVEQVKKFNSDFVPEVSFLKFCYIDFPPDANIDKILTYYKKNIEALKKDRPGITFVHFTVPLTAYPNGLKSRVKRFVGARVWEDGANVSRAKFNALLHETFPEELIFDIARIESTRFDGSRTKFMHEGRTYFSLAPEYTNDGGHLNTLGKRVVASEMVVFLANTLTRRNSQP